MSTSVGGFKRRAGKTTQSRRALKKYEPKIFENPKKILFLRGASTSEVVSDSMTDIAEITKPHCKKLPKRNAFHPFEGREHLEFLGFKNDCSLFCFGSDSKKRPHNLVLGRHFDFHVLDMVELGVLAQDRLDPSTLRGVFVGSLGSKPCFVFEGSEFETEPFFVRLRNFFVDYFRGTCESELNLDGIERCVSVSLRSLNGEDSVLAPSDDCVGSKSSAIKGNTVVRFRHYAVVKNPATASNVRLVDIGPNFDFELRRVCFAPPGDFKLATKLPREALAHLKGLHANISTDAVGNLRGQLHLGRQDVSQLTLRRFAAFKKKRSTPDATVDTEAVPDKKKRRRNVCEEQVDSADI